MAFNFDLPEAPAATDRKMARIHAIIITRAVLCVGLYESHKLITNNFSGYGDLCVHKFARFLSEAAKHFKE